MRRKRVEQCTDSDSHERCRGLGRAMRAGWLPLRSGVQKFKIECFPNRKNNNATTIEGTYEFAKLPGPSAKQRAKKENKAKS